MELRSAEQSYSRILVPLDGSRLSEIIVPYAQAFAKTLQLPVELLQVVVPEAVKSVAGAKRFSVDAVSGELRDRGMAYLEGIAQSFTDPSRVRCRVESGHPAEVIVREAAEPGDSLVLMATRGHSGVKKWFMGSVANKVLQILESPLLLVRATDEGGRDREVLFKRFLVPLDGSEVAELVLPHAVTMAKAMDLEVELVRIYSVVAPAYVGDAYPPQVQELARQKEKEEAQSYLQEKTEQLKAEGVKKVSWLAAEGDAAGQIIDLAQHSDQGLVSMCTHGRSGVGLLLLGSVTNRVVRHAHTPVLVIRARRA